MSAKPGRVVAGVGCVFLLGPAAVVLRLMSHGPIALIGAVVIATVSLAVAATLRIPNMTTVQRGGAILMLAIAGEALTISLVGRAPMPLAIIGVGIAHLVLAGSPLSRDTTSEDWRVAIPSLLLVATGSLLWLLDGSISRTGALWIAAAGVEAALTRRPTLRSRMAVPTNVRDAAASLVGRSRDCAIGGLGRARDAAKRLAAALVRGLTFGYRWCIETRNRPLMIVGVVVAMATAPIFWRTAVDPTVLIRGTNDINSGRPRIHAIELWPFHMPVAHPPWFVIIRYLGPIIGENLAITVVGALSCGAAAMILMSVARSRWDDRPVLGWSWATAFTLGYFLLESPALLVPRTRSIWGRFSDASTFARGMGYAPMHQWATPTIVMSLPFVFAMFWLLLLVIARAEDGSQVSTARAGRPVSNSGSRRVTLGVLTIVTTLVQPAATLALVPAVVVYLVLSKRLTARTARAAGWSFVVPGALICLGEAAFLASKISEFEQATWVWKPFWVLPYFGGNHLAVWMIFLFFPLCAWVGGRRYVTEPAVALSFLGLVISLFPFLLLEQTTVANIPDGDLGVPPLMALILLLMASLRFVLIEAQEAWHRRAVLVTLPNWVPVLGCALVIMACAGIVDFLAAAGVLAET